jgi:histidinol-phosphate/aromatic aminotransferase/cobyric acid decarboxylase-like protein
MDIHHPQWTLRDARASFAVNSMATASGIALPAHTPLLHFARRQDVVVWSRERLTSWSLPNGPD